MSTEKEAFISSENRPHVGPETPLAELKVRDLRELLAGVTATGSFPNPEYNLLKAMSDKPIAFDLKSVVIDFKILHPDIPKSIKEYKDFLPDVVGKLSPDIDPGVIGRDPEIDKVVRALSSLTEQVSQLNKRVEALQKERG